MSEQNESRPTLTAGRQKGEAKHLHRLALNPVQHFSKQAEKNQAVVYPLLFVGEENALTAAQLSAVLGIPARSVTKQIRAERLQGFPIAASGKGFFIPRTRSEAAKIARKLHHRAAEINAVAAAIERVVSDPPGQTMIAEG